MGATVVSIITASHELATQFNQELAAVVEKRAAILSKIEAEAERAFKSLEPEWSYEAKDASQELGLTAEAKAGIRLIRKWTNKAAYDQLAGKYGKAKMPKHEATSFSQVYYRVNGVLVAAGHGLAMLTVNLPCSDTEWNLIAQGNIPSKFMA